jgi:exosortase A-associated hydrolase 2
LKSLPAPAPEPFFLSAGAGRCFCVRYVPPDAARGSILFVPAFGEEMNKSRRMVALQARALAARGWAVLILDLFGCGDSEGDLAGADWATWRRDVRAALERLRRDFGHPPAMWSMRAGCLLACDVARELDAPSRLLLWQPHLSGRQALHQLLRLRIASQALLPNAPHRETTEGLRDALRSGATLDIAGYRYPPSIALPLEDARLEPPSRACIAWLEVTPEAGMQASAAARARAEAWQRSGVDVSLRSVAGDAFWQTLEITECAALLDATCDAAAEWLR